MFAGFWVLPKCRPLIAVYMLFIGLSNLFTFLTIQTKTSVCFGGCQWLFVGCLCIFFSILLVSSQL